MTAQPLLLEIKLLNNLIKRKIDNISTEDSVEAITGMQGFIIGYLSDHIDEDIFQRDLETRFELRRPTATNILNTMEKGGLITREPVSHDARLKKLTLTDKAISVHKAFIDSILELDRIAIQGLSAEDTERFLETLRVIKKNIE